MKGTDAMYGAGVGLYIIFLLCIFLPLRKRRSLIVTQIVFNKESKDVGDNSILLERMSVQELVNLNYVIKIRETRKRKGKDRGR